MIANSHGYIRESVSPSQESDQLRGVVEVNCAIVVFQVTSTN